MRHPGDRQLDTRADAELRVDVVQVQLGGAESNSEAKSDLLVLQAGCGERRNLVFAPGQLVSFHLALMVTRSQRKGDGRATLARRRKRDRPAYPAFFARVREYSGRRFVRRKAHLPKRSYTSR